jgi:tetraacyldisaccharide-1-P 4'-kinase
VFGAGCIGLLERTLDRTVGTVLDRTVVRRLDVPAGVAVVAVGGSTFGGSGKTPVAIACAAELASLGVRTALVGHAHRATPGRARLVTPGDELGEVGDEALLAARALAAVGGRVVVAPTRAEALAFAARQAEVLVIDGVAQLAGERAALALLAVDAAQPWGGSGALPLRGGLRARRSTLLSACDAVVPVGDAVEAPGPELDGIEAAASSMCARRKMWPARVESRGAWVDGGTLMTWEAMRSLRVGLCVALGRPERILRWLARRHVLPQVVVRARDHGPFGSRARRAVGAGSARGVDVWLATPKCALHATRAFPGLPLAVLEHAVVLDLSLRNTLRAIGRAGALTAEEGTNSLQLLESTRQVRSGDGASAVCMAASNGGEMTMMMRPRA